ncbi:MAG TPA: RNA polymerase sigma factor [Verrucomicrobiae bacterium]|nr:RNA polymerase sigma factor [Verrucomicrobiae bacterium]
MRHWTDQQLLHAYASERSEAAFAELATRHVDLVHSAALRMTCDASLAEEVTQNVFIALAKSADQLAGHPVLVGWLHRATQNLGANAVRATIRRQAREQEAVTMNALPLSEPESEWDTIAPQLDAALGELTAPERDAVLLRYFQGRTAREIGELLGISAEAAQKRVARAVEQLRKRLARRGVTVGVSGLAVALTTHAVQAAPISLAAAVAITPVATGAALASTFALTPAVAMTTLQKSLITAALFLTAGAGLHQARQAHGLRVENESLQRLLAPLAAQVQKLREERDTATTRLASLTGEIARLQTNSNNSELLQLRGEVAQRRATDHSSRDDPTQALASEAAKRVKEMKRWLAETPGESIPELQLLSDRDWMFHILNLPEGKQDAWAASIIRTAAKRQFAEQLGVALGDYLFANQGQLPARVTELAPYLGPQIDDAMLSRYEVSRSGSVAGLSPAEPLILEKDTVHTGQYDTRFQFGAFEYRYQALDPAGERSSGSLAVHHREELERLFKQP